MNVLYPLAAGFVRRVHIDGRHQFTQRIAVQFFNANILAPFLNKLFNVFVLPFLYPDLLLQGDRFRFQLLLLCFIGLAQHMCVRVATACAVDIEVCAHSFGNRLRGTVRTDKPYMFLPG